jgi:hypothetical protein
MNNRRIMALGWSLVIIAASQAPTHAKIIQANSPSQKDVAAAISSARAGDTVLVPPGNATWTESISLSENITLKGAGISSTVITTAVNTAILLSSASRITGFSFYMTSGGQCIRATGRGWRVDHCYFETARDNNDKILALLAQKTGAHPYGLLDNCEFVHTRVLITGPYADQNTWTEPTQLGTADTVVIEDSVFREKFMHNVVDANYGGHFVVRNCTIYDGQIQCHGIAANLRATRKWEIYNNTFIQKNLNIWTPMFLRAGTGVIYNNTLVGRWNSPNVTFDVRRGYHPHGAGGISDGSSFWDGNDPLPTNGTGTHTGAPGATLTDGTKQWGDELLPLEVTKLGSFTYHKWVYNLTSGARGLISRHTKTTVTAALSGGTRQHWQPGDLYKITGGYWSRDQIGRGQDAFRWASMTDTNSPAPAQASEPVYIWGQIGFEGVSIHAGNQNRFLIQEGRDYIIGTPKPGYIPLRYPHPLRQEDDGRSDLDPPRRLRILLD